MVQCTAADQLCPSNLLCGADLYCHQPGDDELCEVGGDAGPQLDAGTCDTEGALCGDGQTCFEGICGGAQVVEAANTCLVRASGSVWCWGQNFTGRVGQDPGASSPCGTRECVFEPTRVEGLPPVERIVVGRDAVTCALTREETVWCWGDNRRGQLGHDNVDDPICSDGPCSWQPQEVVGLTGVTDVSAGVWNVCAVVQGEVHCWGAGDTGVLGEVGGADSHQPVPIDVPGEVVEVAVVTGGANASSVCARSSTGAVYCWGSNINGQLGRDPAGPSEACPDTCPAAPCPCSSEPTGLTINDTAFSAVDLDPGDAATMCAISAGVAHCWGYEGYGHLGTASGPFYEPQPVTESEIEVERVTTGLDFACARTGAGAVYCWGSVHRGQLGNGTTAGADDCVLTGEGACELVPKLAAVTDVIAVEAGSHSGYALTESGELFVWGNNSGAELGHEPGTMDDMNCSGGICNPTPAVLDPP